MKCPHCGALERGRIRTCQHCGTSYASEDLLELRQIEFLLAETAAWPEGETRSKPYALRLAALRARILPESPALTPVEALPEEAVPGPVIPVRETKVEPSQAQPESEPVPFTQWLLSERNIKIALYSGGILLVLAGLIFVGVNWTRLPGPAKFAITLMITGLMYLGGYLLFQRPYLKLGGVALLGVGSGFVPLNFVVLQVYIFSARGVSANLMWAIGSLPSLLLYFLTAYWTRVDLFTYLSLGAIVSAITAVLVLMEAAQLVFFLAYALLFLALLLGARGLQSTRLADFTYKPLLLVTQLAMPVLFFASAAQWVSEMGCQTCSLGNPWLAISAMLVGVLFYVVTDITFHWAIARWAAAFGLALTMTFAFIQLRFSDTAVGILLMVTSLANLLAGHYLERRAGKREAAWPLYAAGYALAVFVTFQALATVGEDPDDLAKILIGDVVLLAVSAWVHRQYEWIYAATWAFIIPVFLYASLYLQGLAYQGMAIGVLMLNYGAVGYALGHRSLRLGGPFLSAAAFLSVIAVLLTWENGAVASVTLVLTALLYFFAALWLGWSWLLLPTLVAINLLVVSLLGIFFSANPPWEQTLTLVYAGLGVVLSLGGASLRRSKGRGWGWPLYVVAAIDLTGSYVAGLNLVELSLERTIAIALSGLFAGVCFGLAWIERASFTQKNLPPLLTYLGVVLIFVGQHLVLGLTSRAWQFWPAYMAGLCMLLVALSWLIRREALWDVFGTPFRLAGVWSMVIPMVGSVFILKPLLLGLTFAIAGITYAADAAVRKVIRLGYLAGGAFIVMTWSILFYYEVTVLQAYAIPLGLGLLTLAWSERRRGNQATYRWSTLLGLLVLIGSAFYQSIEAVIYAVLLLFESLATVAWGFRKHSRGFVRIGVLALLANALAQLGPGFVELPRWVQLGVIGSILLGGGLVALFQREQLLSAQKRLTHEWRQWEP